MNILYLACHESLECDELSLLTNLGHKVFSIGHYTDVRSPVNPTKQNINLPFYEDWFNQFCREHDLDRWNRKIGKLVCGDLPPYVFRISKNFADNFHVVIVGYYEENITLNWPVIKDKLVILRGICQFPYHQSPYKNKKNVKIINMAPCEDIMRGWQSHALIRHACDTNFHSGYVGGTDVVLTVQKWLKKRKHISAYEQYEHITKPFNRVACGFGNEDLPYGRSNLNQEEIQSLRQTCGVYYSTCSAPGNLTYSFCEALSTGCPMVVIGPKFSNLQGLNSYEAHSFIKDGVNGFWSNSLDECKDKIKYLLDNPNIAMTLGKAARSTALKHFSLPRAEADWRAFLDKNI